MLRQTVIGLLFVFGCSEVRAGVDGTAKFSMVPDGREGYFANNIPGGLRAHVDAGGFALLPAHAQSALARFEVIGCGRSARQRWIPGEGQSSGGDLYFPGTCMGVHYQHSEQGLRQNFIVFSPPQGEGALHVELRITGPAEPMALGADGLRFRTGDGNELFDYRDLHCWDAFGTVLKAHFELKPSTCGHTLNIVVDDAGAHYPVTIDPVSTSPSTLLVGPQAGQEFGIAVATAGDLNGDGRSDVAVGAWQTNLGQTNEGAVYVYYGTNTGISTTASVILQSDQQGAQMGCAVSTAGDVNGDGFSDLIVGVRSWESSVAESSEGAAFVYYGSSTGISTVADAILQTNHANDGAGSNVACAGDLNNDGFSDVLVGAYLASYPTLNEGAVMVYMGGAGGISTTAQYRLERDQGGSFFGRSVAGAGDINGDGYSDVIIGATKWIYTAGASDQGSAFVYYGSAAGLGAGLNPAPALQLFGSGANTAYYGWWVTSAGDLNGDGYSDVAVSAYNDKIGAETAEGLVYVYHGSNTGLVTIPAVVLQGNQANAWLGRCVTTAGDVNGDGYADLLVGAPRYSSPESLEGVADLFLGSSAGIGTSPSFIFQLNNAGANLGESVCGAGDVNGDGYSDVLVGARIYGSGGAAALFLGGSYSTNSTPTSTRFGAATDAQLGMSIANAGDVNGDGYTDMISGAPGASNGQAGEGLAYIHYGSASGLPNPPSLVLEANVAGARFGTSVSSAGDVNGDGYADVLVGAPAIGNGNAYVYMGGPAGLNTTPALTLSMGSQFGTSVAPAGDVNSDGFADVIIGAPGSHQAFIIRGSITGLQQVIVLDEPQAGSLFPSSVSSAGDVNGDGYSDVIVGASNWSNGQTGEGVAFVYHGSTTGTSTTYARMLEVNQAAAAFGVSVSGAGDVNGDGYSDVIVGADRWESGQLDEGAAFIFHGSATGVPAAPNTTLQRNIVDARMGRSVGEAGDVNGDGYADVVIGSPLGENPAASTDEGLVYVFRGSNTGIAAAAYDQLESNVIGYRFGTAVSGGGDVDGDGYSDILIGAAAASPSFTNEGATYWFKGCIARAINRFTRQYDADLVSPLSTNSADPANFAFFGVGHRARSPIQRCRARLRWEVVNEGQPWSGSPITNSVTQSGIAAAWTTLPLTGTEIKQLIQKGGPWLRYKWRLRVEYDMAKLIDGQRFSRWFYGFANAVGDIGVLPLELTEFTGYSRDEVNDLFWTTASEHNTDRFEVERSVDANSFTAIGSIRAMGESSSATGYSFVDAFPPMGTAYYRLRMIDQDGTGTLSPIVAISRANGIAALFPNPADDQATVLIGEHQRGSTLFLLDAQGRLLRTLPLTDDGASYMLPLDISDLAAGTYTLLLRDAAGAVNSTRPLVVR